VNNSITLHTPDAERLLSGRISKSAIQALVDWAIVSPNNFERLYCLTLSPDTRTSVNALWVLTHIPKSMSKHLQARQNELVDRLLCEAHPSMKRMLLKLLREQTYAPDNIRTDFLDYCLTKINSQCEPYAIRCFSIYCAFKLSRFHPELVAELEEHLNLLETQKLTPGLQCALRTTRRHIAQLNHHQQASV